jgi:hypothetical protein
VQKYIFININRLCSKIFFDIEIQVFAFLLNVDKKKPPCFIIAGKPEICSTAGFKQGVMMIFSLRFEWHKIMEKRMFVYEIIIVIFCYIKETFLMKL